MALSLCNCVACSNTVSIQCDCKIVNSYFVKCLKTKKSRQRLPHCRELKLTRACYIKLLDRYHIVVNRLSAVYDRDLSVGEGLLKRCGRSLGIVLSYILAIVNGDDLGIKIAESLGHFAEH